MVLSISGIDSVPFLQGLVTNQMLTLGIDRGSFNAFLNAKGRVLYDAFIYRTADDSFLVEVDASNISSLEQHLRKFVLRSKVTINHCNLAVWQAWPSKPEDEKESFKALETHGKNSITIRDPRHRDLGFRFILDAGQSRIIC